MAQPSVMITVSPPYNGWTRETLPVNRPIEMNYLVDLLKVFTIQMTAVQSSTGDVKNVSEQHSSGATVNGDHYIRCQISDLFPTAPLPPNSAFVLMLMRTQ